MIFPSPRHIAFVVPPAQGHINPTLAIIPRLVAAGNRITYATTKQFYTRILDTGAEPIVFESGLLTEGLQTTLRPDELPDGGQATEEVDGVLVAMADEAISVFCQLEVVYAKDVPDLIVYDSAALSGKILAMKLGVPAIQLFPTFACNDVFSLLKKCTSSESKNIRIAEEKMSRFLAARDIQLTGQLEYTEERNIAFFPKEFQYDNGTFDSSYRFVGPCLDDRSFYGQWSPPMNNENPILLISLGTSFNFWPEFFSLCVEAFADQPIHVVMSVGGQIDPKSFMPLPDNIEMYRYISHLSVLPHTQVFIGQGGMNSTMEALYHGVPMLLIPQMQEQEIIAQRVEELGCGKVLFREDVNIQTLRELVSNLAGDKLVRNNVQRMQLLSKAAGGVEEAVEYIDQCAALMHSCTDRKSINNFSSPI